MSNRISDVLQWYVIKTQPKQEIRAECNLRAWGFETFLPKMKERHTNPFTGLPSHVIKPLFPRYVFVQFDVGSMLRRVCFTRGVHSVVSFGAGPTRIDDEIIRMIQLRVGDDGLVKLKNELNHGDKVMIEEGPFRDLIGIFQYDIQGSERVAILLTAISYQGRIVIEKDLVKKVI